MKNVIAIDIGGTKVALGRFDLNGSLLEKSLIPFNNTLSPHNMMQKIFEVLDTLINNETVSLGFCVPGPLKLDEGIILNPPNLPLWHMFKIVDDIKKRTDLPFVIENDANTAALAEFIFNNDDHYKNTLFITISTGIGAGIVINGKLFSGTYGNAGEIGHISVDPHSDEVCPACGQRGCLENLVSGTAIASIISKKLGKDLTTSDAFDLYRQGNHEVIEMIDRCIAYLGQAIVTLINLFDPQQISLGGGVMANADIIIPKLNSYVENFALSSPGKSVVIKQAKVKHIGLVGAASIAINKAAEI